MFWETVFDVISLAASVAEVCINPTDPWAWAGLAGDAVDLIPFVTGIGEVTDAVRASVVVIDGVDNVVDAAKAMRNADNVSDVIKNATGSYEILYKSGKNYVGKGGFNRAIKSAQKTRKIDGEIDDVVESIRWKPAPNHRQAFKEEFIMQSQKRVNNSDTYNKIWSPGRRYFIDDLPG